MRPTVDEYFLLLADAVATRSTCYRRRVGCVLVDEHRCVLATGYNGVARGQPHCNEHVDTVLPSKERLAEVMGDLKRKGTPHCELVRPDAKAGIRIWRDACEGATLESGAGSTHLCQAIHAEQNALVQCRDVRSIETCYVTCAPCPSCAKLLLATGCTRVVFAENHHSATAGLWETSRGEGSWIWHREPLPVEISARRSQFMV